MKIKDSKYGKAMDTGTWLTASGGIIAVAAVVVWGWSDKVSGVVLGLGLASFLCYVFGGFVLGIVFGNFCKKYQNVTIEDLDKLIPPTE